MKKKYLEPTIESIHVEATMMICGSNNISSDIGINYGGVDEDGTKDPSSRKYNNLWDDQEE